MKTKLKAERSINMKKTRIATLICFGTMIAVLTGMIINTVQTGSFDTQGATTLAVCTVMYCSAKAKYENKKKEQSDDKDTDRE